MRVYTWRT